ncbi:MAG: hypothetical protein OHK93_004199 [Ramalina farinacea]|uniref:Uncharacterized protein n=1 Tax=Ramalina farinacea TaxID=258253 RepID=A0AA43QGB5_9LECA|nr:hypothetical protein [Ramalina farinacea]
MPPPPPPPVPTLSSRIRDSLHGLATTDAPGGAVKFRPRGSSPPVTGLRYNSNFDLPPGSWTDDTSRTLSLASSLSSSPGSKKTNPSASPPPPTKPNFDIPDQGRRYIAWFRTGYLSSSSSHGGAFDVGGATRLALDIWEDGFAASKPMEVIQARIDDALDKENRCGNGSLMRCAPVGQGRVTHPHEVCVECCACYGGMIAGIMSSSSSSSSVAVGKTEMGAGQRQQLSKPDLFSQHLKDRQWVAPVLKSTFSQYPPPSLTSTPASQILSSGYVIHTLEAALWAFFTTDTFAEGALKVVKLGDAC